MKLSTQLTHFDSQTAVCLATLEDGEKLVTVYASARATEAGNYADLAQQRALNLAWRYLQEGDVLLQDSTTIIPTPVREKNEAPQSLGTTSMGGAASEPEISSTSDSDNKRADDVPESGMPW